MSKIFYTNNINAKENDLYYYTSDNGKWWFYRVSSVVVYVGSANFHFQARTSVNVIVKIADDAAEIVLDASRVLKDLQKQLESGITADVITKLNSTAKRMDKAVDEILKKTWKHRRSVNKTFQVV